MARFYVCLCCLGIGFLSTACTPSPSFRTLKPEATSARSGDSPPKLPHIPASSDPDMQIIDEAIKRIEQDYITPVSRRTLTQACLTSLKQPAPETDDPIATRAAISEALQRAQAGDTSHPSATEECLRGMMTSLNQHSRYMGPLEFKELRVGTADLAAIGLEFAAADEGARVVGVLEGGPGARARIKSGTILTLSLIHI